MGGWKFFRHAKTKHDAIGVKDQGKGRFLPHQAKTESVSIELFGAGYVDDERRIQ